MSKLSVLQNARVLISTDGTNKLHIDTGKGCIPIPGVDDEQLKDLEASVSQLSEEIEALKEEGGISGGTTTVRTGKLIAIDCDEVSEIVVESETTEAVTLVHCGKNLMPSYTKSETRVQVTITPNEDGTVTLNGTANSSAWPDIVPASAPLYLPAGTYTVSAQLLDGNSSGAVGLTVTNPDTKTSYAYTNSSASGETFTLQTDAYAKIYFTITSGRTFEYARLGFQLENGSMRTDYQRHVMNAVSAVLPTTLSAYDGENVLYTQSGDKLTVTTRKSVSAIINETVKKRLAVDYSKYGLPILYLTGDITAMTKDNAVDLEYAYKGSTGSASVKWQGSSSLSYPKKNYTIKFDNAFEAKEGWGAQKKYCFKANFIDHSHARNVCSCKLWGEIVKSRANVPTELSSLPNGGAIDGFPCIIMLNDEFHGLYTWNIPKDGWMFGSPKAILCADAHTDATNFKALATLNGDFELEYVEDENNADWVLTSINTAIQAVMDSDGTDIDTVVGQYIDIPSAIDYFIHTVDENADDGMDKNYILVTFDGVKWYFSAYDRDTTYGIYWDGTKFTTPSGGVTYAYYASKHRMMYLLFNNNAADLKARASDLRDGIKSEVNVAQVFSNFICNIPSQVLDADAAKWPTIPSTSASNLAQILNWYRLRRQVIDKEIDAM